MTEIDIRPICIDLFCGLGGWSSAFIDEGYRCIGYDIEAHDYGTGGYPGELILRDVTTIHGSEFKEAACIVASPPCQRYSYMAMPWSHAKAQAEAIRADDTGEELRKLNLLFDTCFRLQRESHRAKSPSGSSSSLTASALSFGRLSLSIQTSKASTAASANALES